MDISNPDIMEEYKSASHMKEDLGASSRDRRSLSVLTPQEKERLNRSYKNGTDKREGEENLEEVKEAKNEEMGGAWRKEIEDGIYS
mmetsp:Transcript_27906/g.26947  ORF Transcript_27906/g.26947 Transcript_27906/m.26947 type:complete len:86 (-) Transcript_27906:966-1223(-)